MIAAGEKLGRERAEFGTQNIGGPERVRKAGQVSRFFQEFDADQPAVFGQSHVLGRAPVIAREMIACPGCIRDEFESTLIGA